MEPVSEIFNVECNAMYLYVQYVFILQNENNTQNIMPGGQQGLKALTAGRSKKCLDYLQYDIQYDSIETKQNKNPSLTLLG